MCGTVILSELKQNLESVARGPLPDAVLRRLDEAFGHIDEPLGN